MFCKSLLISVLLVSVMLGGRTAATAAEFTIAAEKAAVRTEGGPNSGGGWNLWSNGRVGQPLRFATGGNYGILVRAWGSSAAGIWPEMALLVDGRAVKTVTVGGVQRANYRFEVNLIAGIHEIAAAFLNDAIIGKEDRNLYLERFTIIPPPGAAEPALVDKRQWPRPRRNASGRSSPPRGAAIDKHRKADAKIRVVDAAGRPLPGVKVSVEQINHDFLFGGNIYGFDRARNASAKRRLQEAVRGAVQLRHGRLLLAMV